MIEGLDEMIEECLRRARTAKATENYIARIRARDTAEPLSALLERVVIMLRRIKENGAET